MPEVVNAEFAGIAPASGQFVVGGKIVHDCCSSTAKVWRLRSGRLVEDQRVKSDETAGVEIYTVAEAAGGRALLGGAGPDGGPALWRSAGSGWKKQDVRGLPSRGYVFTVASPSREEYVHMEVIANDRRTLQSCDLAELKCHAPTEVRADKVWIAAIGDTALAVTVVEGRFATWFARRDSGWRWEAGSQLKAAEVYAVYATGRDLIVLGADARGAATWRIVGGSAPHRTSVAYAGGLAHIVRSGDSYLAVSADRSRVRVFSTADHIDWRVNPSSDRAIKGMDHIEVVGASVVNGWLGVVGRYQKDGVYPMALLSPLTT